MYETHHLRHAIWIRSLLFKSRYLFYGISILALGYAGFSLLYAGFYQAHLARQFEQELKSPPSSINRDHNPTRSVTQTISEQVPLARIRTINSQNGDSAPLGRIEIRRIGLSAMIMEGTDDRTLRRAVGHFPVSALPGQQGNVAIAGHRDTFFRALRNIRVNDEITLETIAGVYRYRVDFTQVVDPTDMDVVKSSTDSFLTLVTCYPFTSVGAAPKRFVVRAHRVAE